MKSDETPQLELQTYRDTMRKRSPTWLQRGLAEKILYSLAVHLDALGDAVTAGVKLRFPNVYSAESLPTLSRERRIVRGNYESDEGLAARLSRWLIDHHYRGNPYAMLTQLFYHYLPAVFDMDIVYANGRRFSFDAAIYLATGDLQAALTRDLTSFRPADGTARWARWWLFLYTDTWATVPPTAAEIEDLRLIPHAWNAAHCLGTIVIFSSSAEMWNWPLGHVWNEAGTWNTDPPTFIEVDPL